MFLYIMIWVISLTTGKMVPGVARVMERTKNLSTNSLIICRYLKSEDNFIAKENSQDVVTLKF